MRQELSGLGSLDLLTAKELHDSLGHHFDALMRHFYRADTAMRLPVVQGSASAGALNIVSTVGPRPGYAWDISLLSIDGLTTGSTPDTVNVFFNGGPAHPWWQLNGNNFAYTFSRGQLIMLPGETITLQSVGTFASTSVITLIGMIRTEMPAEKLGAVLA